MGRTKLYVHRSGRASPFLRAANIGFRCVKYIALESVPKVSLAAMPSPRRDLSKEKPVADAVFNAYRGLYSYDNKPLNATVEPFTSADDDWKIERIIYDAPYGGERAIAYLFLPAESKAPLSDCAVLPRVQPRLTCENLISTRPEPSMPSSAVAVPSLPGL